MEVVDVDLGVNSYKIHIGSNILASFPSYLTATEKKILITDEIVDELYGQKLIKICGDNEILKIVLPAGEYTKNLGTVEAILRQMLESNLTRYSSVIALGGGVIGDLAGFCASIYMRGIPFIQIPTTLLAQVDSSVGGKTGVNLDQSKNVVGSFYQPQGVFIDITTLETLPKRHLLSGMAEVVKYGIIYDSDFFLYLRKHFDDCLNLEPAIITQVIKRCCEIKANVVAQDEKEQGVRKILNHGHTVGHALETVTKYQKFTHGEAVLRGMYLETLMAKKLKLIDLGYYHEIADLFSLFNLDLGLLDISQASLIDAMLRDKKNKTDKISFILPEQKGQMVEIMLTKKEASSLLESLEI